MASPTPPTGVSSSPASSSLAAKTSWRPSLATSNPANQPVRFIAEGRDASATIDAGLVGTPGFQNDDDKEITGIHVSDGDIGVNGVLGAKTPKLVADHGEWRAFWTQQHGDNYTWELLNTGN